MTEPRLFSPSIDVLRNMTKRATAIKPVLCTKDGCDRIATKSACSRPGRWCPEHFAAFGITVPTPNPTATAQALHDKRQAALTERGAST